MQSGSYEINVGKIFLKVEYNDSQNYTFNKRCQVFLLHRETTPSEALRKSKL